MYRVKCSCGQVYDIAADSVCKKCNKELITSTGGILQIYRMGSPIGIAAGYGLYIDGKPMGHLANKQSVQIPLALGTHTIHCTCGMTRKCIDLTFTLSAEAPVVYAKAHIVPGFWTNKIVVEEAGAEEMPSV